MITLDAAQLVRVVDAVNVDTNHGEKVLDCITIIRTPRKISLTVWLKDGAHFEHTISETVEAKVMT